MPFPAAQRVIYSKNPLDQVICQLRFPPILKIESSIPADFQEVIRGRFPNYSETSELRIEPPASVTDQMPPELIKQLLQLPTGRNFAFTSEDALWEIHLTRTFLALSTPRYERWEVFKHELELPFSALAQTYEPNHLSRIGLRYVNVIRRSRLGLAETPWRDLIAAPIVSVLGEAAIAENVTGFESSYEVSLGEADNAVRIVTKFVRAKDDGELCYMIDCDYYCTARTDVQHVWARLDFLNSRSSRLIRWAITDRLHQAMEPNPA